jgi:hypothetical protein
MPKIQRGVAPTSGGNLFLRPEKTGTIVYLLTGPEGILSTPNMMSCFVTGNPPAPCNASWIQVPCDPGLELGIKTSYNAWVPVAVKEEGVLVTKVWQTNKTNHTALVNMAPDWDMVGLRVKIAMVNNRWGVTPMPPVKNGGPTKEEVAEAVANIPEENVLGALLGPEDAQGVKELLMKRLNVTTWGAVQTAFKVPVTEVDEDVEVEEI